MAIGAIPTVLLLSKMIQDDRAYHDLMLSTGHSYECGQKHHGCKWKAHSYCRHNVFNCCVIAVKKARENKPASRVFGNSDCSIRSFWGFNLKDSTRHLRLYGPSFWPNSRNSWRAIYKDNKKTWIFKFHFHNQMSIKTFCRFFLNHPLLIFKAWAYCLEPHSPSITTLFSPFTWQIFPSATLVSQINTCSLSLSLSVCLSVYQLLSLSLSIYLYLSFCLSVSLSLCSSGLVIWIILHYG